MSKKLTALFDNSTVSEAMLVPLGDFGLTSQDEDLLVYVIYPGDFTKSPIIVDRIVPVNRNNVIVRARSKPPHYYGEPPRLTGEYSFRLGLRHDPERR